jgi:transcriptional regulator with XRE-family HTH domain
MFVNLKVSLWQTGTRQNQLARALHIDEALLSRIINGYREPTPEQRARIAQILHKDEAWLFERASSATASATAEGLLPDKQPAS